MYGILFDQTYINMIIFGLIIFFIMFLWRKLTVIEGNIFILEKRVYMMKKSDRKDSINKNFEAADIVMNEIFKDSTIKNKPLFLLLVISFAVFIIFRQYSASASK